MFIKEGKFRVSFSKYSKKHYRKKFSKKYRGSQWEVTEKAILESLSRAYKFQGTNRLDELWCNNNNRRFGTYKFDFSVAGTRTSPKSSGNRIFLFLDNKTLFIDILIIFHHNDMECRNETEGLKKILKNEFPEYWDKIFNNSN